MPEPKSIIIEMKQLSFLLCFLLPVNSILVFPQQANYLTGKVIDSTTKEPVPFATIMLKDNQLGVFANIDGDFKVIDNPKFQGDSIIITCIGYKRYSTRLSDLNDKTVNKILLAPAIYKLNEVKVVASRKRLSSVAIIARAIRNIKNNFPITSNSYISYYRDYQKRDKDYLNMNEAIIQTLDNGFLSKSTSNRYRLLNFRENMDFHRMNISPYYDTIVSIDYLDSKKTIPKAKLHDQGGNELFILMIHDAIRNFKTLSFSFINTFSDDFLLNHDFSEPTQVFNNDLLLYKINFNAKRQLTGDSVMMSGDIYIQPKDFSIHKLDYAGYYLTEGANKKDMFNVKIEYGKNNSVNSSMYLKYISFNNLFRIIDIDDSTFFRVIDAYWDPVDISKTTLIVEFNNTIDPNSAVRKENYEIMYGDRAAKIKNIEVGDKKLIIRLKDENLGSFKCNVNIQNIKDINGNILNIRKYLELCQYRELFVQEYNKSLTFSDSCYLQHLPLNENCISKYTGNDKYWMNTPINTKIE